MIYLDQDRAQEMGRRAAAANDPQNPFCYPELAEAWFDGWVGLWNEWFERRYVSELTRP